MQYTVKLYKQGKLSELKAEEGKNLLQLIRENESDFYAPCGGNGTCGKCRVHISGEGHVTSCLHTIHKDIEVLLPGETEMKVLSSQYKFTKEIGYMPGKAVNLSFNPLGLAVDIGTTTLVFYFIDMHMGSVMDVKTMINPQTKYGSDVISRINYGEETENGIENLQKTLIGAINKTIKEYCAETDYVPTDVVKISVVGNTVMLHNLLGVSALSIALAPFTPKFTDTQRTTTPQLSLNAYSKAEIVIPPSLSGYVGADIIAGLASLDTSKLGKNYLFIDIGTNGEMVLVTPEKILACATAAGPAFEGANISCGISATTGAISEYSATAYKVIGNTQPVGICGSGLIDIVAHMLEKQLLNTEGNIEKVFIVDDSDSENKITINQQDIRELQLAKSAIAAGIVRLLFLAGINTDDLDQVLLAGGFGNYIKIKNAIAIGLLPDIKEEKYIQIGNTAGTGAVLSLKSEQYITEMENLKAKMEYVELSTDPDFAMEYAMNMFFPD